MRVDIGKECSGISTELRPLIDIRNWFSLSIFGIRIPIFFKLGMRVDIVKECSGCTLMKVQVRLCKRADSSETHRN